jgi:phosphoglucomutase
LGVTKFDDFEVEVVDPVGDYLTLLKEVFDFELIKSLLTRSDFSMKFDGMHAVTGAYAKSIFVDELGARASDMLNDTPLEVCPLPSSSGGRGELAG